MKINKLNESMIPSQEILDDCLDDYLNNAFGYNGVEDYVATQYPNHPSEWQSRICDYLKQHKNESLDTKNNKLKENADDEFFEIQDIIGAAMNSIGGDMDDITGGITPVYDEDKLLLSFYSTVNRKDARKFDKNFTKVVEDALSQTRFSEVNLDGDRTYAYHLSKHDIINMVGSERADEFLAKFAMFECLITAYGRRLDEAMNSNKLTEWNEFSDDDFEDDIAHSNVYGGDSKYCRDCGAVKVYDEDGFAYCPKCNESLTEAKVFGAKGEKKLDEASYGGAYDIADDQYFTREDLQNFADEVIECIAAREDVLMDVSELFIDGSNITLGLNNAERNGEFEHSIKFRVDMRKIKYPHDLSKYVQPIASDFITEYKSQCGELNEATDEPQYDVKFTDMERVESPTLAPVDLNDDIANQLQAHFEKNKLYCDVYYNDYEGCLEYDINWGDWKHEHLRSKWLLEELFEQLGIKARIESEVTEENGSDCYSARYMVYGVGTVNEALEVEEQPNDVEEPPFLPNAGDDVLYRGKMTKVLETEDYDPEYDDYDCLIRNPFWNGEDERFKNIWVVSKHLDPADWGPNDIGLQPPA